MPAKIVAPASLGICASKVNVKTFVSKTPTLVAQRSRSVKVEHVCLLLARKRNVPRGKSAKVTLAQFHAFAITKATSNAHVQLGNNARMGSALSFQQLQCKSQEMCQHQQESQLQCQQQNKTKLRVSALQHQSPPHHQGRPVLKSQQPLKLQKNRKRLHCQLQKPITPKAPALHQHQPVWPAHSLCCPVCLSYPSRVAA